MKRRLKRVWNSAMVTVTAPWWTFFTLNSLCGVNIHITAFTEGQHPHIHVSLTVSSSHGTNTPAASKGRNSNLLALAVNVTFRHVHESGREWWCNDVCFGEGGLCVWADWVQVKLQPLNESNNLLLCTHQTGVGILFESFSTWFYKKESEEQTAPHSPPFTHTHTEHLANKENLHT